MSPIAAIGFDLGETLLTYADTPPSWSTLYAAALTQVAMRCEAAPDPAAKMAAAKILTRYNTRLHPRSEEISAEIIFGEILETWSLPRGRHLQPAIEAFFGFFQQRLQTYPETLEVLGKLRGQGIRIGVLTDVPYGMPRDFVQRDLAAARVENLIDRWLTSVQVGWRKPEPAGFHALARALEIAPPDLWYVGNEEKDIVGARNAGCIAVLVDREDRRPNWGQRHTIRDLREVLAYFSA